MKQPKTILKALVSSVFALSLLLPTQSLLAGATSSSVTLQEALGIGTSQSNQNYPSSQIPDNTTFSLPGNGLGSTAVCSNFAGKPSCAAGAADPINVMTGNSYQESVDMAALPGTLGIEIVRHYNSLHMDLGQIGYGWRLSYESKLYAVNNTLQIVKADGTRIIFNRDEANPNACACQNPAQGHVMVYPGARGKEYTWFQLDGKQLHFNHQGELERISVATGESVHLTRGPKGELLKVTDPQGRSLIMHYADKNAKGFKGIIAIDSPAGRFEYAHDNDSKSPGISNLILVRKPAGNNQQTIEQHYHYGEKGYVAANMAKSSKHPAIPQAGHLLTGISHSWQEKDPKDNNKTISKTERYRSWTFDKLGRANLGVHGYPKQIDANGKRKPNTGIQQVDFNYQPKPFSNNADQKGQDNQAPYPRITRHGEIGKTIITNSQGQETVYTYTIIAGEYRVISIIGAGCSECMEPNLVYGYDKVGRITHITKVKVDQQATNKVNSAAGKANHAKTAKIVIPLHTKQTEYDSFGRIKRIASINYIDGKPQTPQLLVRYEYPSTPALPKQNAINALHEPHKVTIQPSLIAKPSVIAGKEHQWHITYNDHGQPTKVTETGYRPALAADVNQDTNQGNNTQATQISRTLSYQYKRINGRSLLASVDGPLPNGKTNSLADSDITAYEYDKKGRFLTKTTYPSNLVARYEYDIEGSNPSKQLIKTINPDGLTTQYAYNNQGALNQISQAGITVNIQRDVQGRVIAYHRNDGARIGVAYNDALSTVTYTMADGQKLVQQHDTEQRLTTQNWQDANGNMLINPSTIEYAVDTGKPSRITAASGLRTDFNYNSNGKLINTQQGKKTKQQAFDPVSNLLAVKQNDALYTVQKDPEQSALALTLPNGATHIEVRDDFGRIIMNQHPDSGIKIANYDAADHTLTVDQLDAKTLSKKRSTTAKYDVLGRITEERHVNHAANQTNHSNNKKNSKQPNTANDEIISYQYQGTRLTNISSPAQDTHYQYNALGQLTQHTVTLKEASAAAQTDAQANQALTYTTHYTYDQYNRIQTVQLPEQATLTHTYNLIGQLDNIDYQGPAHSWWVKAIRWVWHDYGTQPLITNLATNSVYGLTGFTHSNGLTASAKHDKAGRLVNWQDGQVSSQLTFNKADELDSIKKQTPQIINAALGNQSSQSNQNNQSSSSTQTQQLAYNVYGQLTQVNATAAQTDKLKNTIKAVIDERYQLDLNGNRLSNQDKNQPNQHYQYQANSDQLLAVKGTHHTKYAYNSLGEPIQIQQQNKQSQLNRQIYYGARGQISRITDNGKPTATYQYNHARQRTHKQTQSQNTYYLWHGGLVDAEIEQSTATSNNTNNNSAHITKRYIYLGLKPVAVIDYNADKQARVYAIHTDYLGTPQAVTNAKQQVVWRAEYTPFGQIKNQQAVPLTVASDTTRNNQSNGFISTANASTNPQASFTFNLRFAGQYADEETGYYYNWHRYYNPETGRYLTPDPIGLQGGMNAYAYTNHDPAMSVDPWGLLTIFIGGAGDSSRFMGFGPTHNMRGLKDSFKESADSLGKQETFHYDGYENKDAIMQHIVDALAKNPDEEINLVGHSLGGWIAAQIAEELPKLKCLRADGSAATVNQLITLDPVGTILFRTKTTSDGFPPVTTYDLVIPKPVANNWINILAAPVSGDFSDFVASQGGRWKNPVGANADYSIDTNHKESGILLYSKPPSGGKSAAQILMEAI